MLSGIKGTSKKVEAEADPARFVFSYKGDELWSEVYIYNELSTSTKAEPIESIIEWAKEENAILKII